MLNEKIKEQILALQKRYPEKRSALIPALHLAQEPLGYLPEEVQAEVAALFEIDTNEVRSVVTFYDMFYEKPQGKHILHVCKNVSCMLKGSDALIDTLRKRLNLSAEGNSPDGEFTLIRSECLAACDKAPMMLANGKVFGPIEDKDLDSLLETVKSCPGHPSPAVESEDSHG